MFPAGITNKTSEKISAKISALLIVVLAVLGSHSAQAGLDVTCRNQDCLTQGWSARDAASRYWAETDCVGGDCRQFGWITRDGRGAVLRATCLEGGCFSAGWTETASGSRYQQTYLCQPAPAGSPLPPGEGAIDCLSYGWVAQGPYVFDVTTCLQNSCRSAGWVSRVRGARDRVAICKTGLDGAGNETSSCFQYGWSFYER